MIKQSFSFKETAWLDYIIVTILLWMSGNPVFMGETRLEFYTILTSGFFLILLLLRGKVLFTARFIAVIFILSSLFVLQCMTFDFWRAHAMYGILLRVFIGYAAVRLVRDFPRKYINVMYYTCLISFFFHLLAIMYVSTGIDLIRFFTPIDRILNPYKGFSVLVHSFNFYARVPEHFQYSELLHMLPLRNSSYFWEPGAFSAYILLAIVFLSLVREKFEKLRYIKILAVLVIALLTTMSTAGYALLPLCLLFHLKGTSLTITKVPKILGLALALVLFCAVASQLDFVGAKILRQRDRVAYHEPGWHVTRFGGFVFDLEYIKRHPFLGWGPNHETRYLLHGGEKPGPTGNGLSDFTAKFGLIGLLTSLACIFIGVYRLSNSNWKIAALFVFFVVMVLNGEYLFDYPAYLGLMFLGSTFKNWRRVESSAVGHQQYTVTSGNLAPNT